MPSDAPTPQRMPFAGRRSALALGAGLAILAAAGVTAAVLRSLSSGGTASAPPALIMVIGDSLADGLANGLRRLDPRHRRYTVLNETRISSGLAEHDGFDWTQALGKLVQERRPDAIVMLVGLNDARPGIAAFGSAGWEEAYRKRIAAMIDITEKASIPMFWVGLPVMRDPELHRHAAHLNELYRDELARAKRAHFIDVWALTGGGDAAYKPFMRADSGSLQQFRETDGIHFTSFGYDVLADRLWREIAQAGVACSDNIRHVLHVLAQRSGNV